MAKERTTMSHRTLLRPVRTAAALTLAAAAAFGLTACDNSVGGADAAGHASSASASSTSGGQANADGRASDDAKPGESATTGGSAGGSGTSGGGATVARGAARAAGSQDTSGDRCSADALRLELGQADTGAGNIRYPLSFTNTGRKSCTLRGYPGIALLAKDGSAIGHPADREGSAGSAVTLAPGGSAHTVLHTINEGLKDGGCWKDASLVQVYAPGSKTRMTARAAEGLRVCGNEFLVSALESGSGS
ncbi:DUF4232 domain-containing protein [Streptomyces benahoarensis]|uniref:DUF4232 domain-containing protein n=1 Tax=Streptomyces benahoarensis TaxID=2595054 RepID=A0A553XWJ2_9ACTN|nr:DUF4232 domain-containing protein [Streptomyces benahoarensis]TSB21351.1 DUF4232 domain-containing protein [Streptomyces benahoarensis]